MTDPLAIPIRIVRADDGSELPLGKFVVVREKQYTLLLEIKVAAKNLEDSLRNPSGLSVDGPRNKLIALIGDYDKSAEVLKDMGEEILGI